MKKLQLAIFIIIGLLSIYSFSYAMESAQKEDEQTAICTICYQPLHTNDITTLRCHSSHSFHLVCIRKWAQIKGECPFDRTSISPERLGLTSTERRTLRNISIGCGLIEGFLIYCLLQSNQLRTLGKSFIKELILKSIQELKRTIHSSSRSNYSSILIQLLRLPLYWCIIPINILGYARSVPSLQRQEYVQFVITRCLGAFISFMATRHFSKK